MRDGADDELQDALRTVAPPGGSCTNQRIVTSERNGVADLGVYGQRLTASCLMNCRNYISSLLLPRCSYTVCQTVRVTAACNIVAS